MKDQTNSDCFHDKGIEFMIINVRMSRKIVEDDLTRNK